MPATCQATRKDGRPCETRIVGDSRFCFAHSPELAEKRAEASRRGGRNKSRIARLYTTGVLEERIAALEERSA